VGESVPVIAKSFYELSSCSTKEFSTFLTSFSSMIDYLESHSESISDFQTLLDLLDLGTLYGESEVWYRCKALALSYFDITTNYTTGVTKDCLHPLGSPEAASDPCCNTTLQMYYCCANQAIPVETTYRTLSSALGDEDPIGQCRFPNCLKQQLQSFEGVVSTANCDKNIENVLDNPKFNVNPYLKCRSHMIEDPCYVYIRQ